MEDKKDFPLQSPWNIWYHHTLNDWYLTGYKQIFTIKSIKDFWDFHNNLDCLGGITNAQFFMMRDTVTPVWEDPMNRNGGSWSILVPVQDAQNAWEHIAVLMIGENLCPGITGLSINQKNNIAVIKIWNTDKNHRDSSTLTKSIQKFGNILYRAHKVQY
jgi:hypothetical protein